MSSRLGALAGASIFMISLIFLESAEKPLLKKMYPKNSISDLIKTHLFLCKVGPFSLRRWHTSLRALS